MNKLFTGVCALAAASAPSLAQAENKIYGQFNVSANHVDAAYAAPGAIPSAPCTAQTAPGSFLPICAQDGQSGDNNASRLGFQGEKGQFFYAVEVGVDADGSSGLASTRHAFVGFNSGIGTFTFGRTNTPYKLAGQRVDPFYDTSAANYLGGFSPEGASYGSSNLNNGWTNNSVAWLSPEFGGLTLNAGAYLQEFENEDHDFNIGVDYISEAFNLGVQYVAIGINDPASTAPPAIAGSGSVDTALQVTASTQLAGLGIGASYELVELRDGNERAYLKASVTYDASDNVRYAASFGSVDQGQGEGVGVTIGAFVKLIEQFQMYALYSSTDFEITDYSNDTFGLGVKFSFEN